MKNKILNYQEIHLVASSAFKQKFTWQFLTSWLILAGAAIANLISADYEPKVWEKKDQSGTLYWRVYDPTTGHTARFGSEIEVRMWLEQHYTRFFD